MTTGAILEGLLATKLETIQESSFLGQLEPSQTKRFKAILTNLGMNADDDSLGHKSSLVFRGEKLKRICDKLSTQGSCPDETKILRNLFYFGDKAKHYYKVEDAQAKKLRLVSRIEDTTEKNCSAIFMRIKEVLSLPRVDQFRKLNEDFANYFAADNLSVFTSLLVNDQTARDYYLFFLHTVGYRGIGYNSILVSTSLSYETALDFSNRPPDNDGCVIFYVVPEPLQDFAISHLRMQRYDQTLIELGLPTYKEEAVYPEQQEVANSH